MPSAFAVRHQGLLGDRDNARVLGWSQMPITPPDMPCFAECSKVFAIVRDEDTTEMRGGGELFSIGCVEVTNVLGRQHIVPVRLKEQSKVWLNVGVKVQTRHAD